jgi:hypothetical protein
MTSRKRARGGCQKEEEGEGERGHQTDNSDVLEYLVPQLPKEMLAITNHAGSPALHWAILNNHVSIVKVLAELPESHGGGLPLLKVCTYPPPH